MPSLNEQIADAHSEALSIDPDENQQRAMEKTDLKFQKADEAYDERGV